MKTEPSPIGTNGETFGLRREARRRDAFGKQCCTRKSVSPLRSATALQNLAVLFLCVFALLPCALCAATNDLTSALQKGLFEEEANHNLEAAAQAYQTVSARFDQDRKLAATAIFRLGEVYRKQGKTNEAGAQYERIVREFSDQSTLATLSRQNLAGIGRGAPASASTAEKAEVSTRIAAVQNEMITVATEIERLNNLSSGERGIAVLQNYPNPVLTELMKQLSTAEQNLAGLRQDRAPEHPDVVRAVTLVETINKQIEEHVHGVFRGLYLKLEMAKAVLAQLEKSSPVAAVRPPSDETSQAANDDEAKEIRRIQAMIRNSPDLINSPGSGGFTPLHTAANAGQLTVARFLLDNKANVDARSESGETPLTLAASLGHKAMVELLLSRGADVNARGGGGNTALHSAALRGFHAVAEVLVANKAELQPRNDDGKGRATPLHLAAESGQSAIVELLIAKGAEVNAVTGDFAATALIKAVSRSHSATVKALLAGNADSNAKDNGGRTPLSHAAEQSTLVDIVRTLLAAKADPNIPDKNGRTPLSYAAPRGDVDFVKTLIEASADVNAVDAQGITAMSRAVGDTNVVKLLLEAKADPNLGTVESPLLSAVRMDNAVLAEMLLRAGANPNQETGCSLLHPVSPIPTPGVAFPGSPQPSIGAMKRTFRFGQWGKRTPLQAAALEDHTAMVKLLLQFKGDPKAKSPDGYPLVANTLRDAEMLRAFLEAGADANASDWNSRPVLLSAAKSGNVEAVKLLLTHGAEVNARDAENQTPLDFAKRTHDEGATPDIKAFGNELAALLRKHGARDDLPKMDRIEVRRTSANYSAIAFQVGTNGWNEFSLLELLALHYGFISTDRNAVWEVNKSTVPRQFWRATACQFPELSRVIIRRADSGGQRWTERTVDAARLLEIGDCAQDVKLQPGDIVEIPEADHPVNEQWPGLADQQLSNLLHCVSRTVTVSIKGTPTAILLTPQLRPMGSLGSGSEPVKELTKGSFMLKSVLAQSRLLRASSDLSRVKVTRRAGAGGKAQEWVLNCGSGSDPDLWLRGGDVIEVPDKP